MTLPNGTDPVTIRRNFMRLEQERRALGSMSRVDDAPSDGRAYARKDGEWEATKPLTIARRWMLT